MPADVSSRIENWNQYNSDLIDRGRIDLWVSDDVLQSWSSSEYSGQGRPRLYGDSCIETALTLCCLFTLTLRGAQGFLLSLFRMCGIDLPVPNYTTLCRRRKSLDIDILVQKARRIKGRIVLAVDATGLKVYGEGEWKTRVHGKDRRRTWRKVHLATDINSFQVLSVETTASNKNDGKTFPTLMKDVKGKVGRVLGDAAYMSKKCFDVIASRGGEAVIDIHENTAIAQGPSPGLRQRNRIVREMRACEDKKDWKRKSGYHRRSLVETQMYRLKQLFGAKLSSRKLENQRVEVRIRVKALNRMTAIGMPRRCSVT